MRRLKVTFAVHNRGFPIFVELLHVATTDPHPNCLNAPEEQRTELSSRHVNKAGAANFLMSTDDISTHPRQRAQTHPLRMTIYSLLPFLS
jgi:hypothetical protein